MKNNFFLLVILLCASQVFAQVSDTIILKPRSVFAIKGDYYFSHGNYQSAIDNYTKSVSESPNDVYSILRLADAHRLVGKNEEAASWFAKALSLTNDVEDKYLLSYISVLNSIGKYDLLEKWIAIYSDAIQQKSHFRHDSTLLLIHPVTAINSDKSDISPVLYNNKLFFSSNRSNNDFSLYGSSVSNPGEYGTPASLLEPLSGGTNKGPLAIATKTGRLFFTGSGQTKENNNEVMELLYCDIPKDPTAQVKINKLEFKSFKSGAGHPAVNSDGTLLFFTSNNPKSKRGFDLYRTEFSGKGWSAPRALSSEINTNGDEMYPSLYNDSILYFASNGRGGMGGFDIYRINLYAKNAAPEHLHAPFNSSADDLGLIYTNQDREGYLTSSRAGGMGAEDIYRFYLLPVETQRTNITNKTNLQTEGLSIYTSKGSEIKLADDGKRNFSFEFVPGMNYTLVTDHDDHQTGINKPSKRELTKRNIYTFHIQKSRGGLFDQRKLQDIHVKPGDLVTFQLIPKLAKNSKPENSRIRFNRRETVVSGMDTIVFSYVAEEDIEAPATGDAPVLASNDDKKEINVPVPGNTDTKSVEENPAAQLPEFVLANNQTRKSQPALAEPSVNTAPVQETQPASNVDKNEKASVTANDKKDVISTEPKEQSPEIVLAKNQTSPGVSSEPSVKTEPVQNVQSQQPALSSVSAVAHETKTPAESIAPQAETATTSNNASADKTDNAATAPDDNTKAEPAMAAVSDNTSNTLPQPTHKTELIAAEIKSESKSEGTVSETSTYIGQGTSEDANVDNLDFKFRVQIAASRSQLTQTQLKKIYSGSQEIRSFNEEGYVKYYIKETPSYSEARQVLGESGVKNAFIAAYKGGVKWKLSDAIAAQKNAVGTSPSAPVASQPAPQIPTSQTASSENKTILASGKEEDSNKTPKTTQPNSAPATQEVALTHGDDSNNEVKPETTTTTVAKVQENTPVTTTSPVVSSEKPDKSTSTEIAAKDTSEPPAVTEGYWARNVSEGKEFKYRVQIAASRAAMSTKQLKTIYQGPLEIRSYQEDGYYKYYIQETPSYYIAKRALSEINVENAFITAWKDDTKWKVQEAIALQYQVPDAKGELTSNDSVVKIVTVNFDFDEYVLPSDQAVQIREYVVVPLKDNEAYRAIVNGYTDVRGTEAYNYGLSQERAFFVEQMIIHEGIDPGRVKMQYFGESQVLKHCPEHDTCDESIHQANRRVEVLLLMTKQ